MVEIEKIGKYIYISINNEVILTMPEEAFNKLCKAIDYYLIGKIWQ